MTLNELLDEVRNQYNRTYDFKKSLDDTAGNMIMVIGTTTGFLITLAAATLVKLNPIYQFFSMSIVLVL